MKVKVCLIQDSPVFFDKKKTIDKVEKLTIKYAQEGCDLIVFPESFIPGYPRGFTFGATVGSRSQEGKQLYAEYHNNSFNLKGSELGRLEKLAQSQKVFLAIGVTEKKEINSSLYCSLLYISPKNGLMGVHRKIKPTGTERLIWAESDGKDLVTFNTNIGRLGGLICWENYMPLARLSMYKKGVEIYIAPTADSRKVWADSMKHIALEGRCFVLGCNQFFKKSMYPEKFKSLVENEPENMCEGGSIIVSPSGKVLAGPLYGSSGALIADLDLEEVKSSSLDFDVDGHYSRNDIFKYAVVDQPDTFED